MVKMTSEPNPHGPEPAQVRASCAELFIVWTRPGISKKVPPFVLYSKEHSYGRRDFPLSLVER